MLENTPIMQENLVVTMKESGGQGNSHRDVEMTESVDEGGVP